MIILFIWNPSSQPALFWYQILCPNVAAVLQLWEPCCFWAKQKVCFSWLGSSALLYTAHIAVCFLSKAKYSWLACSLRSIMIPKSCSEDSLPLQLFPLMCLLSSAQVYRCVCVYMYICIYVHAVITFHSLQLHTCWYVFSFAQTLFPLSQDYFDTKSLPVKDLLYFLSSLILSSGLVFSPSSYENIENSQNENRLLHLIHLSCLAVKQCLYDFSNNHVQNCRVSHIPWLIVLFMINLSTSVRIVTEVKT